MSEIGVAEIAVVLNRDDSVLPRITAPAKNPLLEGPILPTLLRLTAPNVVALSAGTCVAVAETSYIGRLGTEALAAIALVFPFVILTMTMSGGAMGGGVSSAIARALGAEDTHRASTLAAHALLIGGCFGVFFTVSMIVFGATLLEALGGHGNVLAQAVGYTEIFFGAALIPWLMNTLASILRGTGNMRLPSTVILCSAACQIVLGGVLGLGLGPVPQFGMRGVAAGTVIAYSIGAAIMAWYVFSGHARVNPLVRGFRIERAMFFDILKVGAIACFSPLQSVLTIVIFTHMLARFGNEVLAAYGIGARLEFMLTSLAFAVGIATVPMIGMAIGAGQVARARRTAWVAAGIAFVSIGLLGTFLAIYPDLWISLFSDDPGVREAGRRYLATAAPMYAFLSLATVTYFSSQGAAKVLGPVLAQTARLVFICIGGWWLISNGAPAMSFFILTAVSMVVLGVLSAASVVWSKWGDSGGPVPVVRPPLS
jgi:putative MATE family efflux protein